MPQQSSRDKARPITSFSFAPSTAPLGQQSPKKRSTVPGTSFSGDKADKGEGNSTHGTPSERDTGLSGRKVSAAPRSASASTKPLTSFAPLPRTGTGRDKASPLHPPSKGLAPLAPPPPRPSTARPELVPAALPPPQKKQKRVLATEEDLEEWQITGKPKVKVDKGKNREDANTEDAGMRREEHPHEISSRPPRKHPERGPPIAKLATRPLTATFGVFAPAAETSKAAATAASHPSPLPRPLHSLAAMSPFPAAASTPSKLPSSSHSTPVTKLFGQLPTPVKKEVEDKKPFEAKSILALQPLLPPAVPPSEDEALGGAENWSPGKKGKRGGYLLSGIASRAAHLLNSAKTDQTLWLHDLSRSLSSLDLPAPVSLLAEVAPPAVRLTILSIPTSSSSTSSDPYVGSRGGQRTLLAHCKLELDDLPSSAEATSTNLPEPRRDLVGPVLFSLHSYPTSSSTLPPPSRIRKGAGTTQQKKDEARRHLYVPTNPHDLERFLARDGGKGVEVWVYEPFFPVDLLPEPVIGEVGSSISIPGVTAERRDEPDGDGVEWDEDLQQKKEEERKRAKEAERRRKALVVGRLAVLV